MSLIDDELAKAETQAAESRQALADTVVALQSRLKPSALARGAVAELKEIGSDLAQASADTIRRNPVPTMGVVAAITAFFARRPLARLVHRTPTDKQPSSKGQSHDRDRHQATARRTRGKRTELGARTGQ